MFFHTVYKSGQIFLPFCHNSRVWRTDGRTERQTDRQTDRILIARPRLHSMQRGKNAKLETKGRGLVAWPTFQFWDPSVSPEKRKLQTFSCQWGWRESQSSIVVQGPST